MSIFRKVIVSVIVRKVHTSVCLIPNGYRDGAVWIYKYIISL